MALREFLQLAQTWNGQQSVAAWYMSKKLDGMRAWWDGGITRGMELKDVLWANTVKDSRYIETPKSTGLWTRYGKSIQAPNWWLDKLPDIPLDGELWMGLGSFQDMISVTKKLIPGPEWGRVQFMVFDAPSYREVLGDGEIRNKNKYEKVLLGVAEWAIARAKTRDPLFLRTGKIYGETYLLLSKILEDGNNLALLPQLQLPYVPVKAREMAYEAAELEVKVGGEGIMLRMPGSLWVPKRCRTLLKVKPYSDAEGVVVGYRWGTETELGSKLLGKMGSITVYWQGKTFNLSGFTDEERVMNMGGDVGKAIEIGIQNPGLVVESGINNSKFPKGSRISFKYRELTEDGLPKEARYWRKRDD